MRVCQYEIHSRRIYLENTANNNNNNNMQFLYSAFPGLIQGPMSFMSAWLKSAWDHSLHVTKFWMLKVSKCDFSQCFQLTSDKLYEDSCNHRGDRLLLFWAIMQVAKGVWHFDILTCELVENSKMWNLSRTVHDRKKRLEIWGLVSFVIGYFSCQIW